MDSKVSSSGEIIVSGTPSILRPLISQIASQNECEALEPRRPETSEHFGIISIYPVLHKGEKLVAKLTLQEIPGGRTLLKINPGAEADLDKLTRFLRALQNELTRLGLWEPPPEPKPPLGFIPR